jgi:hypothetical protein
MDNKNGGLLILVVGFTGSGKSLLIRRTIKNKNQLVFDINNEYNLPTDNSLLKSRFIGDYSQFVELATTKKNTQIVFEDSTGFFNGRVNNITMQMIVKKRHTSNNYYFLFHSIHQIPKGLILLSNYIILFKTNDTSKDVERKNPKLVKPFTEINSPTYPKFNPKILKLQ